MHNIIAGGTGICSAIFFLVILFGTPFAIFLSYFAHIPLYILGLWQGFKGILVASVAACCTLIIIGGILNCIIFIISFILPILLVGIINIIYKNDRSSLISLGDIVSSITLLITIFMLLMSIILIGLDINLSHNIEQFISQIYYNIDIPMTCSVGEIISVLRNYFPSILAFMWLFILFINGIIAYLIFFRLGIKIYKIPTIEIFDIPIWSLLIFIQTGFFVGLYDGTVDYLARNAAIILSIPFLTKGLFFIHKQIKKAIQKRAILIIFYFIAFYSSSSFIVITGLGIIESLISFRLHKRF